ncbi:Rhamnulokinase [bioreactor metagenome]|uniref:Rhamnulokinase n=1 Tax=bioreactor metagenome TaxID=1076179 RepID=A0A645FAE0_9ZZZZ
MQAADCARGGIACLNLDAPEFAHPNPDMPGEIQKYCARKEFGVPDGLGEIARCVFESLVLRFKSCFDNVCRFTGKRISLIHLFGGGSKNRLLCQWTADALGVPVIAGPSETTSVGNLLMQLIASREIGNLAEGRQIAARSVGTVEYFPQNSGSWNDHYAKFFADRG